MVQNKQSTISRYGRAGFALGALVCLALLATGCDNGPANRAEVHGSVTVDGAAPETGSISFSPVDGRSPTAGGKIVAGKYSVEVPLGTAKVAIRVPKTVGQRRMYNSPDSPTQPINKESLPSKYNNATELTVSVSNGDNLADFELSTKD